MRSAAVVVARMAIALATPAVSGFVGQHIQNRFGGATFVSPAGLAPSLPGVRTGVRERRTVGRWHTDAVAGGCNGVSQQSREDLPTSPALFPNGPQRKTRHFLRYRDEPVLTSHRSAYKSRVVAIGHARGWQANLDFPRNPPENTIKLHSPDGGCCKIITAEDVSPLSVFTIPAWLPS